MSNLDKIGEKILQRAKEESEKVLSEAKAKKESILEAKTTEAKNQAEKIIQKAQAEAEALEGKIMESAKLRARDQVLQKKEEIVNEAIEKIKSGLKNLDDTSYLEFLKKQLKNLEISDKAVLNLPKDKVELVKKENLGYEISEKHPSSGFSLSDDRLLYNFEFDNFVESIRESLEREIVSGLFGR